MYKIIFSATGRCEKVADGFCSAFDRVEKIDLSADVDTVKIPAGEMCLIAAPVYGGCVPTVALENLAKINGNGAKAVVMVVYGNRAYDGALIQLKTAAQQAGFTVCGAVAGLAQHSLITDVAADRPDQNDINQLKEFAQKIQLMEAEGKLKEDVSVPGKLPVKEAKLPVHPKATANCTGCGVCAAKCPAKAIPAENPAVTDKTKCITCMRCVENCPQGARVLMPQMMKLAGPIMKKVWGKHTENEFYL